MKKKHILSLLILFAGLVSISCKNEAADPTVTYEVTTNNENFDISYLDGNGQNIQETINTNKWTASFTGKKGDPVSLSVKANGLNDKIIAKIIYDGKIIKEIVTYGQMSGENISADISTKLPY